MGSSRTGVNEKIGPRVKVVKVNSDDAARRSVTPLDFLLGVMRDADNPPAIRLRAARDSGSLCSSKGRAESGGRSSSEMGGALMIPMGSTRILQIHSSAFIEIRNGCILWTFRRSKFMRQADLPLRLRVTVAQQALPFAHAKPKPDRPIKYGQSRTGVNEKIGPRVKVVKVNSDDAHADVTPLDFLLGVMRDADSPPAIRLRVAGIVAPYVHRKGEPGQVEEAPAARAVVDDPYGFNPDIADKLESIHRDQERLRSLEPRVSDAWNSAKSSREFVAIYEKAKQAPAYLELAKSIEEKQAGLKCPPNYRELDSRQDRGRLKELEAESNIRPLMAAEEIEQRHLQARLDAYSRTPEFG